ncbi:MAG TPA: hypothetical protein VMQ58_01905 [Candidatus Saccharimonadales bacterium]|nr:hypothetical protein [Candidatus Saccharimonadales bacterium]
MDIFSLRWFVAGIFFSLPLHWLYISVRPKISKMQFEDRLATNTITQILGLVIVVGGFAFSIYGNYLTAKAGGGKVTTDQFNTLANQCNDNSQVIIKWHSIKKNYRNLEL